MDGYARDDGRDEDLQRPPSVTEDDILPACQSCRKRKLRCTRELPACSQCTRRRCACLYSMKQKPGIKSGAVDNLNRRLETLEKLLLDINGDPKSALAFLDEDEVGANGNSPGLPTSNRDNRRQSTSQSTYHTITPSQLNSSFKRKSMMSDSECPNGNLQLGLEDTFLPPLPHAALLQAIVEQHFLKVHHWIPILHQGTFMAKLDRANENSKLIILLHALVSASIKYVMVGEYGMNVAEMHRQIRISREAVMLNAMEIPTVENLQAVVILAFDFMGYGQVAKAWSIIGSLTRTVEYLQLTVEPDEVQRNLLLRPLSLLQKSASWTEEEERRRLFWNVFLLDRICSVTSGWKTSLTSDDVHRRLPSNGGNWAKEDPVLTPYFGIWDKSAAKISNSIAHIPELNRSPNYDEYTIKRNLAAKSGTSNVDVSKLGAFAYCIEATESLSQVTSFFLQQHVNFQDRQEVVSWLTRFKELDLRLVHWKMFLPQEWKDSDVSRDISVINMDPNLTLAHITHNTSMILLHQHIAYKPVDWAGLVALPSSCSTEMCQSAAIETSSITKKYLTYMKGIVNSQFVFCLFVAARVLLVHWCVHGQRLSTEFFSLIESLQEISKRWRGYLADDSDQNLSLAMKYSLHLTELYAKCVNEENLGSDLLGYSDIGGLLPPLAIPNRQISSPRQTFHGNMAWTPENTNHLNRPSGSQYPSATTRSLSTPNVPVQMESALSPEFTNHYMSPGGTIHHMNSSSNGIGSNNFSGLLQTNIDNANFLGRNSSTETVEDELTAMSNILLGQQFLDMDRVIPFDGTHFDYHEMTNL